jgi:hypothetical protein
VKIKFTKPPPVLIAAFERALPRRRPGSAGRRAEAEGRSIRSWLERAFGWAATLAPKKPRTAAGASVKKKAAASRKKPRP